jgi:hypothetical protein
MRSLMDKMERSYSSFEVSIFILETDLSQGKVAGQIEPIEENVQKMYCSNEQGEFGAWGQGLDYFQRNGVTSGPIILVTSAFEKGGADYLNNFNESLFSDQNGTTSTYGHIDYYDSPIRIAGIRSQFWLRTSFIQTHIQTLLKLKPFLPSIPSDQQMFDQTETNLFAEDCHFLSENYQEKIFDWLTGSKEHQGFVWHSAKKFDLSTASSLKFKAKMIIYENLFTLRLRLLGVDLIDPAVLSKSRRFFGNPPLPWHKQIWLRGYGNDRSRFNFTNLFN